MGSKRARKAKKRVQREARRHGRRTRAGAGGDRVEPRTRETASPIVTAPESLAPYLVPHADRSRAEAIGYMGYDGQDFLRKNGECIVAASATLIQRTAAQVCPDTRVVVRGLTFEQLYAAMEAMDEAFCFDNASYARFMEAARDRGMAVGDAQGGDLHLLFR